MTSDELVPTEGVEVVVEVVVVAVAAVVEEAVAVAVINQANQASQASLDGWILLEDRHTGPLIMSALALTRKYSIIDIIYN